MNKSQQTGTLHPHINKRMKVYVWDLFIFYLFPVI